MVETGRWVQAVGLLTESFHLHLCLLLTVGLEAGKKIERQRVNSSSRDGWKSLTAVDERPGTQCINYFISQVFPAVTNDFLFHSLSLSLPVS
jgi:hypothetical protein